MGFARSTNTTLDKRAAPAEMLYAHCEQTSTSANVKRSWFGFVHSLRNNETLSNNHDDPFITYARDWIEIMDNRSAPGTGRIKQRC